MSNFKSEINAAIKALRAKTGKNQEQFAEFCGISYDSLRKWETNKNTPSAVNIDTICNANNISIVDLLLLSADIKPDKKQIIDDIIEKLRLLAS